MESTAHRKIGETCMICEETKQTGIHICNQFICKSCEQELVKTDTEDDQYEYYLKKLRKINVTQHTCNNGRSG
jgi:hypothetical protein